jgi:DNA invertase Pin-like site-specific DNA recombinase
MQSGKLTRVAVYYRVSTDKQDTTGQRAVVGEYLQTLGNPVVSVFEDEGISGTTTNRPAYQRMLAAIQAGAFDMVVTFALDRISRTSSEAIRTILDWRSLGVAFVPVTQPHLSTSSDNPFQNTILAAFADLAQLEREATVKRIKSGIKAFKAEKGRWGRRREVSEVMIDKMLELRAAGYSQDRIAEAMGVSKGSVNKWLNTRQ